MRKIPTVFRRDPGDMRHVLPEVHPDCQWVLDGEGQPLRKYDGTCVMYDGRRWWTRREIKRGKPAPPFFEAVDFDPATGATVGWEPAEHSGFAKWHVEALARRRDWKLGTYELVGRKINGNPERIDGHELIPHDEAEVITHEGPRDYEALGDLVRDLYDEAGIEGIVWHHPDGRLAKLKARDFPRRGAS